MSILKKSNDDTTKQLNIRVSAKLAEDLEALRAEAKAAGYTIDIGDAVEAAISKAIKTARAELAKTKA